ncbi:hypothetical protein HXX76_005788 [Chlamydomonas incerta]|uniref:Uncharacterized protein n=1 Tax=Chlamydomonas incerta TaxID=51695 RepID=A0A835T726_CHLIN|nr:hypothetical protein HXX76_005788 [Chlamydomonas incerta]|eukprot:KAG2438182.1 hypothetical protein HXX76_005788 [Chlamydomonas incerta]
MSGFAGAAAVSRANCVPEASAAALRSPAAASAALHLRPPLAAQQLQGGQPTGGRGTATVRALSSAPGPSADDPPAAAATGVAAGATAGQQQRVEGFCRAAATIFPEALTAAEVAAPPLPSPPWPSNLHLNANCLPQLLDWVTTAHMRPVAVQSILEQHCSPAARRLVAAAARLALVEQEEAADVVAAAASGDVGRCAVCVTSAHLALAALAAGASTAGDATADACAAAVLGVLHHSAGLPLQRCTHLLAARAAEERGREEARRQEEEHSGGNSIYSSAALHFLFQSYRWAVFTGCDTVQPCHLLWALAADPLARYSPLRTDPLDRRVVAAVEWAPPLMGLLERAEALTWPAMAYDRLLGEAATHVLAAAEQQAAARESAAPAAAAAAPAAAAATPAAAAAGHDESAADTYSRVAARLGGTLPQDISDVRAVLTACRTTGLVPSRRQLAAVDERLAAHFEEKASKRRSPRSAVGYSSPSKRTAAEQWADFAEAAAGLAALGYYPDDFDIWACLLDEGAKLPLTCLSSGSLAATGDLCGRVQAWCRLDAALTFYFWVGLSLSRVHDISDRALKVEEGGTHRAQRGREPTAAELQQALLAVADLTCSWSSRWATDWVAGVLMLPAEARAAAAVMTVPAAGLSSNSNTQQQQQQRAVLLACLAAEAGVQRLGNCFSNTKTRDNSSDAAADVAPAARCLRDALPLARRAHLLAKLATGTEFSFRRGASSDGSAEKALLLDALAASLEPDFASIHADLETQQAVAEAHAAASRAVPEGWLRALVAYAGNSKVSWVLRATLRAGAAAGRLLERVDGATDTTASSISAGGSDGIGGDNSGGGASSLRCPDPVLLQQLAAMVEADADRWDSYIPQWPLENLQNLHIWAHACASAAGGTAAAGSNNSSAPWQLDSAMVRRLAVRLQEYTASRRVEPQAALEAAQLLGALAAACAPSKSDDGAAIRAGVQAVLRYVAASPGHEAALLELVASQQALYDSPAVRVPWSPEQELRALGLDAGGGGCTPERKP